MSSTTMSRSAPPPSAQEVTRKLSMHSKPPPKVRPPLSRRHRVCARGAYVPVYAVLTTVSQRSFAHPHPHPQPQAVSDRESDSESVVVSPDLSNNVPNVTITGTALATSPSQHPALSAIAERRDGSGEESEEDEDEGEGGWRTADNKKSQRGSYDETVLMSGYLWKKGERRKVNAISRSLQAPP